MVAVYHVKNWINTALEDHLLTRPSPMFRPSFEPAPADAAKVEVAIREIRERSAYFAGVRLTPAEMTALSAAIDEAYARKRPDLQVHTNPKTGISLITNPLRVDPLVLKMATDPLLGAIIERYLRRRVVLADVDMRRVPPMDMTELDERAGTKTVGKTSSHWHRDIRGRQVKVMVYLTEVGEKDSNFAFLPGTHAGHHRRPNRVEESRFTDEWVERCGITPVECYGPPGFTMVFDTNPIHRLRRKPTARTRDSITFYYTPGQELRHLDVNPADVAALPAPACGLFGGRRPVSSATHD
jgi:hypothetical protein